MMARKHMIANSIAEYIISIHPVTTDELTTYNGWVRYSNIKCEDDNEFEFAFNLLRRCMNLPVELLEASIRVKE